MDLFYFREVLLSSDEGVHHVILLQAGGLDEDQ